MLPPWAGEHGLREVTAVWIHQDTVVDLLTQDGGKITTTEDHPYWNATDKQWQQSQALSSGDRLLTADGGTAIVAGLAWATARTDTAYNLAVDKIHTYYVQMGTDSVLVHNRCNVSISSAQLQRKFKHAADFGVSGNWNLANAEKFEATLKAHVNDPGNLRMRGTYRGDEVIHHLNPDTGVNVMHTLNGEFISGWRLNDIHLNHVLMRGAL